MKLRKHERQQQILSEFRASPSVRLGDLAKQFRVTKETIRRDIDELSDKGLLARTYGGAVASLMNYEPGVRERTRVNPEGRRRMADTALQLVKDSAVLMIDTGATMAHFCERLANVVRNDREVSGLTVVTNSLRNVMVLSENPSIRVLVCPGEYDEKELAMFGPLTIEFVRRFHADVAVFSAGSIDVAGVMDANSEAAAVKRAIIGQSARKVLVIERRKFNHPQFETVCALSEIDDLVTDEAPPAEMTKRLTEAGVAIRVSEAGGA